jgi:hypothetical protein
MSDTLNLMRKLAGLSEFEEPTMEAPGADPTMIAGNILKSAEDLHAVIQGGRAPQILQLVQQIENGLNIIKQTYSGAAPR